MYQVPDTAVPCEIPGIYEYCSSNKLMQQSYPHPSTACLIFIPGMWSDGSVDRPTRLSRLRVLEHAEAAPCLAGRQTPRS